MVARAAQGNPWFFERAKAHLNGTTPPPYPSLKEIAKFAIDILIYCCKVAVNQQEQTLCGNISQIILKVSLEHLSLEKLITAPNLKAMKNALNQFKLSSY